jgi:tetratricopeptide (TPR) repeat protein
LFQQAVDEDPAFAPAWAALARSHRVFGKYFEDRDSSNRLAEQAFHRALELSPDLPLAHRYLTHFESELGRAPEAIVRLLNHASANRNDAQLFAGLVHACRYAGLVDASMAAHEEATRLDPNVVTSVEFTIAHLPDGPQQAALLTSTRAGVIDAAFPALVLRELPDAREILERIDRATVPPALAASVDALFSVATQPPEEAEQVIERAIAAHVDPEAIFMFGVLMIRLNRIDRGLEVIKTAVANGFTPALTLHSNPIFDRVRSDARFVAIYQVAQRAVKSAQMVFEATGGPEMLGMPAATRLSN